MGKRENVQLLVKSTEKIRAKLKWPLYVQEKLNGVRALIYRDKTGTKGGGLNDLFDTVTPNKIIIESSEGNHYILPHLDEGLNKIFDAFPNVVLDGELYIHNEPLNKIIRRLPKTNKLGTVSKPSLPSEDLEFHIFDVKSDKTQKERLEIVEKIGDFIYTLAFNSDYKVPIEMVTNYLADDLEEAEHLLNKAIDNGYEGIVLRYPNSHYAAGSKKVGVALKWKKWHSTECEVLDIQSEGLKEGVYVIKFLLKNDLNDETFLCNVGNSESTEHWDNNYKLAVFHNRRQYIGKKVTVKYYERSGIAKVPFHANVITVRDYE